MRRTRLMLVLLEYLTNWHINKSEPCLQCIVIVQYILGQRLGQLSGQICNQDTFGVLVM